MRPETQRGPVRGASADAYEADRAADLARSPANVKVRASLKDVRKLAQRWRPVLAKTPPVRAGGRCGRGSGRR
jgi:hypothetical protein